MILVGLPKTIQAGLDSVEDLFKEKTGEKLDTTKRQSVKSKSPVVASPKLQTKQASKASSSSKPVSQGYFNKKSPIFYKSSSLKGDLNSKVVELIGDVVVSQDKLVLRGDRAKLFSNESGKEITQVWIKG